MLAAGCSGETDLAPVSTDQVFVLSEQELSRAQAKAGAGDRESVRQLILHYEASANGDALARRWHDQALSLRDPAELYQRAAALEAKSRTEVDPGVREEQLRQARVYAQASLQEQPERSTRELLGEIEAALRWRAEAASADAGAHAARP